MDGFLSDASEESESESELDGFNDDSSGMDDCSRERETHIPASPAGSSSDSSTLAFSSDVSAPSSSNNTRSTAEEGNTGAQPLRKRRRLDVPVRESRKQAAAAAAAARASALKDIDKLLASQRQQFDSGHNGLQARRARTIRACLYLMVKHSQKIMEASRAAAAGNGFAPKWGSRLARCWTRDWIATRTLPTSNRGQHVKVVSIFSDPSVRAAMSAYMRSNKWSLNPEKLQKLLNKELTADEAREYANEVVSQEIPRGLKRFLETSLLPRLHLKPGRLGLSLSTMRRIMLREGFSYMEYRKSVYFDGHERPDVVEDRQKRFLPAMHKWRPYLVKYAIDDVTKEVPIDPAVGDHPRIVLVAHDEMTAQAHDGVKRGWVLDGDMPLKKKGPGRGLHQSDFICSTVGWLEDASVTLEYGKNHDGFWTGELFVKQVRSFKLFRITHLYLHFPFRQQIKDKFIPAFKAKHGDGYIAAILVDHSQGHSAYAEDALRATHMNLRPGGKQARMRDGWFERNGVKITQPMIFPPNHPQYPDQPKGMQQVLQERGLWRSGLLMKCKESCDSDSTDCCARRILEVQPDFREQRSLVEEVIEAAGTILVIHLIAVLNLTCHTAQ